MQPATNSFKLKEQSRKILLKRVLSYREIYIMLIPAMLFYLIFCYGPMYGITLAFKDYWSSKGILGSPWVGFDNFRVIFKSQAFWKVFRNTLEINIGRLIFGFPMPIILALMLNELKSEHYKRTIQTIIYLPHFLSWVIIAGIIFALFSNDGLVNNIIVYLGFEKINFLANPKTFRPMVIISDIWKEMGWGTIIYLAAISGISPEMYEAAIVDGAGRWSKMFYITIPSILSTVSVLLIMRMGGLISGGFDQIFNLYNPAVYEVGDIIDTYVFRIGLSEGNFQIGTAIGLFLNVINAMMLFIANYFSKKISGNGLY